MSWFGALWTIICIGIALAIGKADIPRISKGLMPARRR